MNYRHEPPGREHWNRSFERDTFTLAFADFVRFLLPTLLQRSEVRERFRSSDPEKILAEFDFDRGDELAVVALHSELPRFELRIVHIAFELTSQIAFSPDLCHIDALRIVYFNGNLSAALVWSRTMISEFPKTRSPKRDLTWTSPPTAERDIQ